MLIPFPRPLVAGLFRRRVNRFIAEVDLDGERIQVHVPNTGRMAELLVEGREVYLLPVDGAHRKTQYDLLLVRYDATWVCVDSRQANHAAGILLRRLLEDGPGALPQPQHPLWQRFAGGRNLAAEVPYADHRFDFRLERGDRAVWIEVKSVNLVVDGVAMFPDAPTLRGARHLELLTRLVAGGAEAHVLFVVQRDDAAVFAPNAAMDPAFAQTLRNAAQQGVVVSALAMRLTTEGGEILHPLPVRLHDREGIGSRREQGGNRPDTA